MVDNKLTSVNAGEQSAVLSQDKQPESENSDLIPEPTPEQNSLMNNSAEKNLAGTNSMRKPLMGQFSYPSLKARLAINF